MNTGQTGSEFYLNHKEVMKTVNAIPPLPPSVVKLNTLFADPYYDFKDFVRVGELDAPLSGKLLHLANCASRGTGRTDSIREAVFKLGSGIVKSVAMAECVRPAVDMDLSPFRLTPTSYWAHSVTVVCFAEELVAQGVAEFGSDLSVAAILHDFGKVVLAAHLTEEHCYFLHQDLGLSESGMENGILSINHAEVSAAVAQGWALPEHLIKSIQHHHRPELFDHPLCHGLNIANQLAWQLECKDDDLRHESISRKVSTEALGLSPDKLKDVLEHGTVRLQQSLEAY
ncbi:MAG: HDOD domain-containing protein [Fuerstiella sp.]